MFYFVKSPWLLRKIYPSFAWKMDTKDKILYLTFDDGPHPEATPFVLDMLATYNAKASFFCIGKNVEAFPQIYKRILDEGHVTGNHTQDHLNGWKTDDETYLQNIKEASLKIDSSLFRPPYGRIKGSQARKIAKVLGEKNKVVMWTVLSGDFDVSISKNTCLENVTKNAGPGSIVVFHDSGKALPVLRQVLPATLQFFSEKEYRFEKLTFQD